MNYPRYFVIDSKYRNSGTSNSFNITLTEPIINPKSIKLSSILLPNTVYNISAANSNNLIKWTHVTNFSYTIPDGAYTASALLSQIQTGMNAADANNYALSYGTSTFKVTVTGTAAFTLNFSNAGTCWKELGFTNADTASATSQTGSNTIALFIPYYFAIYIPSIGMDCINYGGERYTFLVPNNMNSGDYLLQTSGSYYQEYIYPYTSKTINQLNIDIRGNGPNNDYNLNGSEWFMILEVTY